MNENGTKMQSTIRNLWLCIQMQETPPNGRLIMTLGFFASSCVEECLKEQQRGGVHRAAGTVGFG